MSILWHWIGKCLSRLGYCIVCKIRQWLLRSEWFLISLLNRLNTLLLLGLIVHSIWPLRLWFAFSIFGSCKSSNYCAGCGRMSRLTNWLPWRCLNLPLLSDRCLTWFIGVLKSIVAPWRQISDIVYSLGDLKLSSYHARLIFIMWLLNYSLVHLVFIIIINSKLFKRFNILWTSFLTILLLVEFLIFIVDVEGGAHSLGGYFFFVDTCWSTTGFEFAIGHAYQSHIIGQIIKSCSWCDYRIKLDDILIFELNEFLIIKLDSLLLHLFINLLVEHTDIAYMPAALDSSFFIFLLFVLLLQLTGWMPFVFIFIFIIIGLFASNLYIYDVFSF